MLLSHLYSWRPVRLKAWPVTDVVSHSLMLSGLLLLAGYFIYHDSPGFVWLVAVSATLISVYGQLYNQLRDYEMDKAAGLKNTAIMLGEKHTRRVMRASVALAAVCVLAAVVQGLFPLWLGIVLVVGVPVSLLFRTDRDMRGGKAADSGGRVQVQVVMVFNLMVTVWLVQVLFVQVFLA
jgi:4-hydroxybenzoate polyprenyltransferase